MPSALSIDAWANPPLICPHWKIDCSVRFFDVEVVLLVILRSIVSRVEMIFFGIFTTCAPTNLILSEWRLWVMVDRLP